jgi:hypothetical protein
MTKWQTEAEGGGHYFKLTLLLRVRSARIQQRPSLKEEIEFFREIISGKVGIR